VPNDALAQSERWTAFLNGHEHQLTTGPRLGEFFKIKRGIATGANSFFIFPRSRAKDLGLPEKFLRPVLPSPRFLADIVVETGIDGYPILPEQLVLLDCALPEEEIKKRLPALHDYLKTGVASGLLDRYLVSKRQPWYAQEQRPPAPFLCTYMGRGTGETKPFRFIWNKSQATAANVYLLLYPTGALKEALRTKPQLASQVFEFLSSIGADMLRSGGRVYGGALHKVEPKELGNMPAGPLAAVVGSDAMADAQLPLFSGHVLAQRSRAIKTA
jgi:predicted aspartyl protease